MTRLDALLVVEADVEADVEAECTAVSDPVFFLEADALAAGDRLVLDGAEGGTRPTYDACGSASSSSSPTGRAGRREQRWPRCPGVRS